MDKQEGLLCIFGATGDLAAKKIFPALQQWSDESLPMGRIWCLGRRPLDTEQFIEFIEAKGDVQLSESLRNQLTYHKLEFNDSDAYQALAERIHAEEGDRAGRRLFFLAVKPDAFVPIAKELHRVALLTRGHEEHRLVLEKPFGNSLHSADAIQQQLLQWVSEEQLYRIDHYLGKEMIRNILTIRFANRIFSESWHGGAIERVEVTSVETAGVEERVDYYDQAGALNDMVQSHLLQMVALVAMAAPEDLAPESLRRAKIDILNTLRPDAQGPQVIGQYAGYSEQVPESTTETAIKAVLRSDSPQWAGTQFIIRTGKKLSEKRTEIRLSYRAMPLCVSCNQQIAAEPNQLVIEVFPQEGMHLQFNSKIPGYEYEIEQVLADYCHSCRMIGNKPEAYVKLLKDVWKGDKTLFTSFEELQVQWRIADSIRLDARKGEMVVYPAGSADFLK
ncbi:glucose-6-phosphate dehydrogenase (NADP(+)) [Desulfobulbus rhabdoformis]|uniref:glucose-6-phosphate dehydrogenase n=1 Tax=Desulfobulbus rhabdoformis TaxID=34032 RepID=UPI001964D50F|nr:glucose-6-phosphate dehydrogenase [Desulfobulbus rhabdoformis]MBM9616164.1 glucose-6-phosphate dehydrogenase (NADP(+)) [Desulfobulbus rhabdoformis]